MASAVRMAAEDWGAGFTAHYETLRQDIGTKRARRRRTSAGRGEDPSLEDLPHIERARETREAVALRLEHGVDFPGGMVAVDSRLGEPGWHVPAFHYSGLCSVSHPVLRLFVTKTCRGKRLTAGDRRSAMADGSPKILGLDREYVRLNATMRGAVAVKLRRCFADFDEFEAALQGTGVQLPNLAAWGGDGTTVDQPELVWLLEHSVNFGAAGRSRPERAWRAARAHLVRGLSSLEAVDEGEDASLTVKNPLCQTLSAAVMAPEPYQLGPTGDTYRRERLCSDGVRDDVVVLADVRDLFDRLRWRAYREVVRFHSVGDRAGFADSVRDIAEELARRGGVDLRAARSTAARVSEWTWKRHDPAKVAGRRPSGPCADLVRGLPLRARQAIGGLYAANKRRDGNVSKMADAYNGLRIGRFRPSIVAVAEERAVGTHCRKALGRGGRRGGFAS